MFNVSANQMPCYFSKYIRINYEEAVKTIVDIIKIYSMNNFMLLNKQ